MTILNDKELEEFKGEINGKFCSFEGCDLQADGLIRTQLVCKKHFKKIRRDNKKRIRKEIEITEDLSILKK